jgi:hypothetical protein
MHLVLRVVRSGCTADMSFERRGRVAQDTVAVGRRGRRRLERRGPLVWHAASAGGGSGPGFNLRCAVWSVWKRDGVKDATLQSDNRVGAVRSRAGSRAWCSRDGRERRASAA